MSNLEDPLEREWQRKIHCPDLPSTWSPRTIEYYTTDRLERELLIQWLLKAHTEMQLAIQNLKEAKEGGAPSTEYFTEYKNVATREYNAFKNMVKTHLPDFWNDYLEEELQRRTFITNNTHTGGSRRKRRSKKRMRKKKRISKKRKVKRKSKSKSK